MCVQPFEKLSWKFGKDAEVVANTDIDVEIDTDLGIGHLSMFTT